MNRRKELTKRFRKVAWGRLYWKAHDRRDLRMVNNGACVSLSNMAIRTSFLAC